MSQMLAEISRIVTEDISNRVTQYDVLFEAITNSIHANSTNIKCFLNSYDSQLTDDTKEIGSIRVDKIKIIDNGDGSFTVSFGTVTPSFLLLEDGFYLLQEDGTSKIIL